MTFGLSRFDRIDSLRQALDRIRDLSKDDVYAIKSGTEINLDRRRAGSLSRIHVFA